MAIYAYCRVSTKSQRLDRQIKNIKEYCLANGLHLPESHIYCEKYTGKTLEGREQLDILVNKEDGILKEGDTLIFDSCSRMSRNANDGMALYESLYSRKVNMIFLSEPQMNTSFLDEQVLKGELKIKAQTGSDSIDNFLGGLSKILSDLFVDMAKEQIRICFQQAQKERDDIEQRVRDGLESARLKAEAEGHEFKVGMPKGTKLTSEKKVIGKILIKHFCKDFGGKENDKNALNRINGLSKNERENLSKRYDISIQEGFHICRNSYFAWKSEMKESKED